jgi:hypothetical protein
VEYQHGSTRPVLHVVHHHLTHPDLHPRRLTTQVRRDNAASTGAADAGPPRGGSGHTEHERDAATTSCAAMAAAVEDNVRG